MRPQVSVTFHNVGFYEPPRSGFRAVTCRQKDEDANDIDNNRIFAIIPCKCNTQRYYEYIMSLSVV